MPDGRRDYADNTIFGPPNGWRRSDNPDGPLIDGWIFGDVQFSDTDAVFVDAPQQPSAAPPVAWDYPDMEVAIFNDGELRSLIQDRACSVALWVILTDKSWRHIDTQEGGGKEWCYQHANWSADPGHPWIGADGTNFQRGMDVY